MSMQYRQIIGSLIYLTITRPDLSHPVRLLNQIMQAQCDIHLNYVKRVLGYVNGNLYNKNVLGYTNAKWAGNVIKLDSYFRS